MHSYLGCCDNFGLTTFKNWQLEAIKTVIKNALIIQPTASGKSLCFSFPTFVTEKLSIVITPTISLMADQVKSLIGAWHQCNTSRWRKDFEVLPSLQSEKYRVLFMTPECQMVNPISILSSWHLWVRVACFQLMKFTLR